MKRKNNASKINMPAGRQLCTIIGAALSGTKTDVPDSFDLKGAMEMAHYHRILPIAYDALTKAGFTGELMEQAKKMSSHQVFQQTKQNIMESRISAALSEIGIPHYILKGTTLQRYYPEGMIRISTDSDFYVDELNMDAVTAVMHHAGFENISYSSEKKTAVFQKRPWYNIEVHFALEDTQCPDEIGFLHTLLENPVPEQDCRLRLNDENLYLHTFFHLYKHYVYANAGVRMFLDIFVLNRSLRPDMERINRRLAAVRLDEFHRVVLRVCDVLFAGAPLDDNTALITDRILMGGAFGNAGQLIYRQQITGNEPAGRVKRNIIRIIFGTSRENLYRKYPILHKAPWLLPLCHIYRAVSGLVRKPWIARLCFRSLRSVSDEQINANKELLTISGLYEGDDSDQ